MRAPHPGRAALPLTALILLAVLASLLTSASSDDGVTCSACGAPIEGNYIMAGGGSYHREHFTCRICSKPLRDSYVVREGKNYHPDCYEKNLALKCDLCGGAVTGRFIQNYWGHIYHARHREDATQCEHCSRFISEKLTGGGWEYEDGRRVCGICRKSAVTTSAEARGLLDEVRGKLRRLGLQIDTGGVRLHLAGLDVVRGLAGSSSDELRGYTDYSAESFLGITTRKKVEVYILYGMPRESAMATLAHEMVHVWQAERGRLNNDEAFSEGSCNYAAWLVLEDLRTPQAGFVLEAMRKSDDPVYGEGFRRVKKFAEAEGRVAWIRQLANEDTLPSGY